MRAQRHEAARLDPTPGDAVVLADVGGTNARFALLADGTVSPIEHVSVRDYAHFADALTDFLARGGRHFKVSSAELAVAGMVCDERCALTNSPWVIDATELRGKFGFTHVHLFNDFEAIAWSLPHLADGDLYPLGGGRAPSRASMAVIGPGTGLGVASLVMHADDVFVIATEGGHSTLPATSQREDVVIEHLRQRFGHVSAECTLSGAGLENLYRAIAAIDSVAVPERSAANITQAALDGVCPISKAALDMFCAMLGTVAGNIALTLGARGGVFIAGGIVPRITDYIARSQFRARFEAKGRLRRYLQPIPTHVILHTDAAFLGLQSIAARRCDSAVRQG
jgi:glucokinase